MDQGVIRRKLAGAQAARMPEGGAERGWPLALARAARDRLTLVVEAGPVKAYRYSLAELLEQPPERSMIVLLEGPRAALGVLILSPEVLTSLIEAQTLGRVTDQPVPARKPTRTDAAMVADWIDLVMSYLEDTLLTEEDLTWTDGFRYTSFLDEARPLGLMLEDAPFKVLDCMLKLGDMRDGRLILALPADGHGRRPQRATALLSSEVDQEQRFAANMREQVMTAETEMQAVLQKLSLPLAEVLALQPGDMLALPLAALDKITLTGIGGAECGRAKLGQSRGMRALRILDAEAAPSAAASATLPALGGFDPGGAYAGDGLNFQMEMPTADDFLRTGTEG